MSSRPPRYLTLACVLIASLSAVDGRPQQPAAAPVIAVESPRDYQVFQRQTRDEGSILVRGEALADCDRVEAQFESRSPDGVSAADWQRVAYDSSTHAFDAFLSARAGGFRTVHVRLIKSGQTIGETAVPHVGVGEVFVVAGQSNSTNYGEVRQETTTGMVVSFDGRSWRVANDPQPGVQDTSRGGSFMPAFGDALYARLQVPIGIAAVGHGSTSARQWLPKGERFSVPPTLTTFVKQVGPGIWESGGALFYGMMERIGQLGPHGFRALLWHQGESDANQTPEHQISGEEYRRLLTQIIHRSRQDAGWNFPWFVAEASYHNSTDPSSPEIRDAQRNLWEAAIALEGPDTDQLTGTYRQNNGAGVHFSATGLQAHGRLWAEKVDAYLETILSR